MINIETTHILRQRVYYEDTDFSGLVYHATYLQFMERGRTEWLRDSGITQRTMLQSGFAFVVAHLTINYYEGAVMDDALDIHTSIERRTPARIIFAQSIVRANDVFAKSLVSAKVTVAAINSDKKPVRIDNLWASITH